MFRKQSLLVRIVFRFLHIAQNCFCPTPTYVHGKIAPCSTSSSYSEVSTACSVYGSPYGHRRD